MATVTPNAYESLSFWARYVLLKEDQGIPRETTLQQIQDKYGVEFRQQVEQEIYNYEHGAQPEV